MFQQLFSGILDFLIPPHCLICGVPVQNSGALCNSCFKQLEFIMDPSCQGCGIPFSSHEEGGKDGLCLSCQSNPFLWKRGAAAFVYNEGIKRLILPLKYADQQNGVDFLINCMWNRGSVLLQESDIILPVPLHRARLRQRRYNQSALLAWGLGKKAGKPVWPKGIRKIKNTPPLGHLNKMERQDVLKGAFEMNPDYVKRMERKTVVLIDDVMTTGATLEACSAVLLACGVKQVKVLVVARVVYENPDVYGGNLREE